MTHVLTAPFSIAHSVAVKVYAKLTIALVVLIACFAIAGYVNALGYKEAIFAFFFLGGFLILFLGFIPKLQFYAFLAGASDASLRDTDISQGSLKGVSKLYEIVLSVLFWFWVVSGFLATWSFEHSPYAMIPVFAAALVLVARDAHYGLISRKFTIALVTIYASVIIFIFLLSTFAPNTQDKVSAMFPSWVTCTADSTRTAADCASASSEKSVVDHGYVTEDVPTPWNAKTIPVTFSNGVWERKINVNDYTCVSIPDGLNYRKYATGKKHGYVFSPKVHFPDTFYVMTWPSPTGDTRCS